jgi:hypothetical protein
VGRRYATRRLLAFGAVACGLIGCAQSGRCFCFDAVVRHAPQLAPMSATTDLDIAIKYAKGAGTALLFKLNALTFMHLGAELAFLSAFPQESEYLYPP